MQILRFPNTEKFEHINLVCVFNQEKRKKPSVCVLTMQSNFEFSQGEGQ
jgi:hypothetical protein